MWGALLKKSWMQILIITVLFYAFGRLGFSIAIAPGNVTPVWLPAGVAVFFMILWGKQVWPGIILGSFFINLHFYINQKSSAPLWLGCTLALLIALGTTLQTLLAHTLFKRYGPPSTFIESPKDILLFSFTLMPIACIVGASCGTLTLLFSGSIPLSEIPSCWLTWYVGDYAGVVLLCNLGLMGRIPFPSVSKGQKNLSAKAITTLILVLSSVIVLSWLIATQVGKGKKISIGISRWGSNIEYGNNIAAFKATLAKHGYIEGENIEYFVESPSAKKEVVKGIIEGFLKKKVDLLFVQTTPATLEAKKVTMTIPIVFSIVTYPQETGVIASEESSGNNLVGTRNYIPMNRQLQVFKKIFKHPKSIAFVHRKGEPNSTYQLKELENLAKDEGFSVVEIAVTKTEEIPEILEKNRAKIDSVFSACDTLIQTGGEDRVIEFIKKYKLPDFACLSSGVKKGSLIGNIADFIRIGSISGEMAAKILKGAPPSSLKTISPKEDTILLNLTRAKELRIDIDKELLKQVSEIVR